MTDALVGDSQGQGLERALRRLLAIAFVDVRPGWTTARLAGEPFDGALESDASRIVVVTGGNDAPLDVSALRGMIERARAAGKALVVVGPVFALTDDAERHDRARLDLRNALRGSGAMWIDAYPLTRDLARSSSVHLTRAGYDTFARRLARRLRARGARGALAGPLVVLLALGAAAASRR